MKITSYWVTSSQLFFVFQNSSASSEHTSWGDLHQKEPAPSTVGFLFQNKNDLVAPAGTVQRHIPTPGWRRGVIFSACSIFSSKCLNPKCFESFAVYSNLTRFRMNETTDDERTYGAASSCTMKPSSYTNWKLWMYYSEYEILRIKINIHQLVDAYWGHTHRKLDRCLMKRNHLVSTFSFQWKNFSHTKLQRIPRFLSPTQMETTQWIMAPVLYRQLLLPPHMQGWNPKYAGKNYSAWTSMWWRGIAGRSERESIKETQLMRTLSRRTPLHFRENPSALAVKFLRPTRFTSTTGFLQAATTQGRRVSQQRAALWRFPITYRWAGPVPTNFCTVVVDWAPATRPHLSMRISIQTCHTSASTCNRRGEKHVRDLLGGRDIKPASPMNTYMTRS